MNEVVEDVSQAEIAPHPDVMVNVHAERMPQLDDITPRLASGVLENVTAKVLDTGTLSLDLTFAEAKTGTHGPIIREIQKQRQVDSVMFNPVAVDDLDISLSARYTLEHYVPTILYVFIDGKDAASSMAKEIVRMTIVRTGLKLLERVTHETGRSDPMVEVWLSEGTSDTDELLLDTKALMAMGE